MNMEECMVANDVDDDVDLFARMDFISADNASEKKQRN